MTLEVILSGKSGSSSSREGEKNERKVKTEQNENITTTHNNAIIMTAICATPMFTNKLQNNKQ